eukprot:3852691-Amphidinium_carterae.1
MEITPVIFSRAGNCFGFNGALSWHSTMVMCLIIVLLHRQHNGPWQQDTMLVYDICGLEKRRIW